MVQGVRVVQVPSVEPVTVPPAALTHVGVIITCLAARHRRQACANRARRAMASAAWAVVLIRILARCGTALTWQIRAMATSILTLVHRRVRAHARRARIVTVRGARVVQAVPV